MTSSEFQNSFKVGNIVKYYQHPRKGGNVGRFLILSKTSKKVILYVFFSSWKTNPIISQDWDEWSNNCEFYKLQ